jgi:hypothetical protein
MLSTHVDRLEAAIGIAWTFRGHHFAAICLLELSMLNSRSAGLGLLAAVLGALPATAQQPAAPAAPTPEVGQPAPDFTMPGATRFGVLKNSIKLSELRGQTVVIAFFIRARTRG